MSDQPHVMIVDDDAGFRRSLARLLTAEQFTTSDFDSAERFLSAYPCVDAAVTQCLIVDVRMPGMGGLAMQSQLAGHGVDAPVIVVTGAADVRLAVRAMRAGAVNFVEKPFGRHELLEAVEEALTVDQRHRQVRILRASLECRLKLLTDRERQTLQLMLEGKNNKAVARAFDISNQTAAKHTARVLEKMDAANPFELTSEFLKLDAFAPTQPHTVGHWYDRATG